MTYLMKGHSVDPNKLDKLRYPVIVQEKLDGVRARFFMESGQVQVESFAQKPLYNLESLFPLLEPLIREYGSLDTEVVYAGDFKGTIQYVRSHSVPEGFTPDALEVFLLDLPDHWKLPCSQRLDMVAQIILQTQDPRLTRPDTFTAHDTQQILEAARKIWYTGGEGVMVKDPNAVYTRGGRTKAWLKLKREETIDGVILAVHEAHGPTGNPKGELGSFTVRCENGIVCNASASKLYLKEKQDLWAQRDSLKGRWCEVKYMQVASAGGLRHPVYLRLREDKQ